jgi:Ca2+-binding EF-hand superfamily protein
MLTLMKKLLSMFLVCLFPFALFAAVEKPESEEKKGTGFPSRGEILKKFDTDQDGKLNEEERANLRKEMSRAKGALPMLLAKKFDKDGDGQLSEDERAAFRKQMVVNGRKLPPHLMQRFDTDGDGTLSDEERAGAKQAWEDRKKEMIKKFDADGNGELSVEERREAIKQAKFGKNSRSEEKKNPLGPKEGKVSNSKKAEKGLKKEGKGEGKKPKEKKKDS